MVSGERTCFNCKYWDRLALNSVDDSRVCVRYPKAVRKCGYERCGEWRNRYDPDYPEDTQERIDEDALKPFGDYWRCRDVEHCDECPAKIDGKKPKKRYGVLSCKTAKILDLLRRQRKLLR